MVNEIFVPIILARLPRHVDSLSGDKDKVRRLLWSPRLARSQAAGASFSTPLFDAHTHSENGQAAAAETFAAFETFQR